MIKSVKLNNNEIKYISFGGGDKSFVIIPGLSLTSVLNSADAVASSYSDFGKEYTVYLFDRPAVMNEGTSIEDIADQIAEAMRELGIEGAYIFGASMGGMIAQMLAIKHPDLVNKMVLGSTESRVNEKSKAVIQSWLELSQLGTPQPLNHSMFEHIYAQTVLESLGSTLEELEKQGTKEELHRFSIQAEACLNFDAYDRLDEIKCKTFVIGAKGDRVLGGEASVELAEKLGCELYMYDGGHAVYDEAPDYKARLLEFFDK